MRCSRGSSEAREVDVDDEDVVLPEAGVEATRGCESSARRAARRRGERGRARPARRRAPAARRVAPARRRLRAPPAFSASLGSVRDAWIARRQAEEDAGQRRPCPAVKASRREVRRHRRRDPGVSSRLRNETRTRVRTCASTAPQAAPPGEDEALGEKLPDEAARATRREPAASRSRAAARSPARPSGWRGLRTRSGGRAPRSPSRSQSGTRVVVAQGREARRGRDGRPAECGGSASRRCGAVVRGQRRLEDARGDGARAARRPSRASSPASAVRHGEPPLGARLSTRVSSPRTALGARGNGDVEARPDLDAEEAARSDADDLERMALERERRRRPRSPGRRTRAARTRR